MGFVVSYMVLFKSFAPFTIGLLGATLPSWCADTRVGQIFWAVLFSCGCTVVSLPRKLSELRFASLVSIMVTLFVVMVIVIEACMEHGSSSSVSAGFEAGKEKKQLSVSGIFSSLPLVIFSYMYQINVPSLY